MTAFVKYSETLNFSFFSSKVTKSVCAGTIAIVRTLPSGHISDDVWGIVVDHRCWHPSKKDVWSLLQRGEELRGCRGILHFDKAKLQQVREKIMSTFFVHK